LTIGVLLTTSYMVTVTVAREIRIESGPTPIPPYPKNDDNNNKKQDTE